MKSHASTTEMTVAEPSKRRSNVATAVVPPPPPPRSNKSNSNNVDDSHYYSLDSRLKVNQGIVDELLLVCGVIGTATTTSDDNQTLVPVTDCLNWLQDLQRALRRDDDNYRPISLLLGKWKVVQQKLLPLVMSCRYDTHIVLTIVKILVILTKPISETTKRAGSMVIDTKSGKVHESVIKQQIKLRENALEQSQMLMDYKRAITHHTSHLMDSNNGTGGLLSVFVSLLAEPLSKTGTGRSDADHLTIELVLHLLRNVLSAEPILKGSTLVTQQSAQLHQELISLLQKELVLEILLVVGQDMESRENSPYNLLMMEILHHLLRNQDPTAVARSPHTHRKTYNSTPGSGNPSNKAGLTSGSATAGTLRSQLQQEKQRLRGALTARHSNFGGTLVVNRPDGKRQLQSAALVDRLGSAPPSSTAIKRKNRKTEPFVASRNVLTSHTRRAAGSTDALEPVAREAQQTLHGFCKQFVEKCYGPVMKSLKNEFRRDSVRLENDDRVIFFRIVWFFSQWWRVSGAGDQRQQQPKSPESEGSDGQGVASNGELGQLIFTMDIFTFNLVLNATDTFFQYKQYAQLAQAVALYCEMMHLLYRMYQSKETTEQIMALGLMDRLFYASEPLDRLPKLLSRWSPSTNTRDYLCDVVELCHVTLKLLESNANDAAFGASDKESKEKADTVSRMKENAIDFDLTSYLSRKVISNHVVVAYTYLLSHYSTNAPHVNHHIIAFFLRLCKFQIATSQDDTERDELGIPKNLLATKTVTLEPMLYNIKLIMVLNQLLNDAAIRNDPDFASILTFAVGLMHNFYQSCQANPLLYVECLFHHVAPHRFCDWSTNHYVSDELRMIAERELLLEETRRFEGQEPDDADTNEHDDDDEPELEFLNDKHGAIVAAPRQSESSLDDKTEKAMLLSSDKTVDFISGSDQSLKRSVGIESATDDDMLRKPKKLARVIDDSSDEEHEF